LFLVGGGSFAFQDHESSDKGPESAQVTPEALVYVYRYKAFYGSAVAPTVSCDEQKVARIGNGRYFLLKLAPGVHSIRSTDKDDGVQMEFRAGQEYFLRAYLVTTYISVGKGRLELESCDEGVYAMKCLTPLKPGDVLDKGRDMVSVDVGQVLERRCP
jgi:hypothetical protein